MKLLHSLFYCSLIIFLCYLTVLLATDYQRIETRNHVPFVMWIVDTIDLFIHEAGHPLFGLLGRFMGFLGGSLLQIIIPAVTVVVFARSNPRSIPVTLYWTGQSIVNVSVYIGDAPYQRLRLISRYAIHDWRWLLTRTEMMEYAEDIAGIVNLIGIIVCLVGIGFGFYYCYRSIVHSILPTKKEES